MIVFPFSLLAGISSVEMYAFSYYYDRATDMRLIGKKFSESFFIYSLFLCNLLLASVGYLPFS